MPERELMPQHWVFPKLPKYGVRPDYSKKSACDRETVYLRAGHQRSGQNPGVLFRFHKIHCTFSYSSSVAARLNDAEEINSAS
jgi:predicted HTH transcriptional regulator